jgi:type I restriction enzyme, R subunit
VTSNDQQHKLDERNHVEKPLLNQLAGLGWEIVDLDLQQHPGASHRTGFTEVVMLAVLRTQLKLIQPWLEEDQIDDVVKQLTASFPGTNLLPNNQHVFRLLREGTSVAENRKTGEKSPTVHFIDFNNLKNNRFIAVCQLKLRILGSEHFIYPDVVLFLNGLPVVVVEAKSPKVRNAIPQAIEQLLRYSEQRGAAGQAASKGEGSAPLFYFNQFIIATCRQEAKFGTITTHNEKHFYRWADPFPRTLNDLDHGASSPNDQQRLVAGMLDHANLLDIIRTFTLFSTNDKGELIKVVGRYQQFRAVKLAVRRLLDGKNPRGRSGIIWHTQGSGKSLTMMFMVREMYRHPALAQWKIVFVTDRTQLEEQLSQTSQNIGFTVKLADSIKTLKQLLASDASDLVMAMIHKFREVELAETFPQLNDSHHILVMTDEAHRSQYSLLAANLDKAIPNATRIGYTGTPLDQTERVFGDYIDKYTMRDAIEDGVTLEIVYEGRTHNAEVTDKTGIDARFADVFSDYNLLQRMEILGYGSRQAYLEADGTIAAKAGDMVTHYLQHVFPNGYKAQIVASSREAAVRYKNHVDDAVTAAITALEKANPMQLDLAALRRLQSAVVISGGGNDEQHLTPYTDPATHKRIISSFKKPFSKAAGELKSPASTGVKAAAKKGGKAKTSEKDGADGDIGIVIVNNMLLTGFDAPVEQVMYLDKVIVAHGLLQAIARVNRVGGQTKEKGFVVDYVGIGHHLKKALDNYDEREQKEVVDVLSFPEAELRELRASHAAIMALLKKHGLTDMTDHDAFFDVFYDEDLRFEFMNLFRQFTKNLNLVFPAKEALEHMKDYQTLVEINVMAAKHFRDARLSMVGIPPKLRAITDAFLESRGIDVKVEPISILDDDFEKEVKKHNRKKTKAAEIEHAVRHHLDVALNDDPELQASFAEALQQILTEFANNWDKIYKELEKLRQRIINAGKEPTYGLDRKKQMPLFRMLRREIFGEPAAGDPAAAAPVVGGPDDTIWTVAQTRAPYGIPEEEKISKLVALTQHLYMEIERELKLIGFWESIPARNKLKEDLQKVMLQAEFATLPKLVANREHIISRLMEIADKNKDIIKYAS